MKQRPQPARGISFLVPPRRPVGSSVVKAAGCRGGFGRRVASSAARQMPNTPVAEGPRGPRLPDSTEKCCLAFSCVSSAAAFGLRPKLVR